MFWLGKSDWIGPIFDISSLLNIKRSVAVEIKDDVVESSTGASASLCRPPCSAISSEDGNTGKHVVRRTAIKSQLVPVCLHLSSVGNFFFFSNA